jgi:hypothetical protein
MGFWEAADHCFLKIHKKLMVGLGYIYIYIHRRRQGGLEGANDPLWKKSLKLTVKFRSPEFFLKIDHENLEFLTKRPPSAKTTPSANPGYAYDIYVPIYG